MFSPDRYGVRRSSFSHPDDNSRPFIGLKTAFRSGPTKPKGHHNSDNLNPLQKAAHLRFSEPATPSILKDRGLRPSDLDDPHKKEFLTTLTSRVFHLALEDDDEEREKIPLERLFTPATDWEEIVPQKKKQFSSSAFYGSDHPTIDDQVELAHKISVSLIDDNNKKSRGQSMYIKRKNKSSKWIHDEKRQELSSAAEEYDEDESRPAKERPQLKIAMKSNLSQEFNSVQQNYEEILSSSQTLQQISGIELGKEISTNLQSPTGKGAALFAKRKKRMDKFIVDETTMQQQQQQQQSSTVVYEATSTASTTTVNVQTKQEQNISQEKQQTSIQSSAASKSGLKLPDLTNILTKPVPPEKKIPNLEARGVKGQKPQEPKKQGFQPQSFPTPPARKIKTVQKPQTIPNYYNASVSAGESNSLSNGFDTSSPQDPLTSIRPGSPPVFMNLTEQHMQSSLSSTIQSDLSNETTNINGTAITANEAPATNSGLHPSDSIQVPAIEIKSQSLKQANNVIIQSKDSTKPVRPCSLPVISLTNSNIPRPFNFTANSPSRTFNSKLEPATTKNSFHNKSCLDASLSANNVNNTRFDLIASNNETSSQTLMSLGKPESPLIEPSYSEMSDVIASTTDTLFINQQTNMFSISKSDKLEYHPSTIEYDPIDLSKKNHLCNPTSFKSQNIDEPKPYNNHTNVNTNNLVQHKKKTDYSIQNYKKQDLNQILKELDSIMEFDDESLSFPIHNPEDTIEEELSQIELQKEVPSIKLNHRDSLINEEELDNFISEIERSFSVTPTILDSINIQDLQPSDFYKSVSRNSLADEGSEYQIQVIEDDCNVNSSTLLQNENTTNEILNGDNKINNTPHYSTQVHETNASANFQNMHKPSDSFLTEPCVKLTFPKTSYSKPEGSSGNQNTNISPWSADDGTIYTAEVKLVQQAASPPSTIINFQAPQNHSVVMTELTTDEEAEKRKSFNLAPKGWGTYNNFYTPVHLGAR